MTIQSLIEGAHAAHIAAHGSRCGVTSGGAWPKDDPCVVIRRLWASTHKKQAHAAVHLAWAEQHRATLAAVTKRWRSENPDRVRTAKQAYYRTERGREYERRRTEARRAARAITDRDRRLANIEIFRARETAYDASHREERRLKKRAYDERKRLARLAV